MTARETRTAWRWAPAVLGLSLVGGGAAGFLALRVASPPGAPRDAAREAPARGAVEAAARKALSAPAGNAAPGGAATRPAAPFPSCTIVVDPGHPSERNSGKTVQNGTTEVHVAWQVGRKLRDVLQARGARVVLTKSREDEYVTNRDRALTANREKADLFLRLHCDASAGSGFAVYYPDRQGTAQGRTGPTREVIARSKEAARLFHAGFARALGGFPKDNGVRGDSATYVGSRQGALTGSIFSEVPSLTVEMCVLTDPGDAAFLKREEGQEKMARALAEGAYAYVTGRAAATSR